MSTQRGVYGSVSSTAGLTAVHRLQNPAMRLYEFWNTVLDGTQADPNRSAGIFFGHDKYHGIGISDTASGYRALAYGHPTYSNGFWPMFEVNAQGEFRIGHLWGWQQRDMIARHTFLRWVRYRSAYNWTVSLDERGGTYQPDILDDWRAPMHYLPEHLMGRGYRSSVWLKLVHGGVPQQPTGAWQMEFSRDLHGIHQQADYDRFEALRLRRYHLLKRAHLIDAGHYSARSKGPFLTPEEKEAIQEKRAEGIAAHLTTSMPARTIPLRKASSEEGLWALPGSR